MYRPLQIRTNTLHPKGKRPEVIAQIKNNWNIFVATYHTKQSVLWRFSSTLLWDSNSMDPALIPLYTRLKISTALIQHALRLKSGLIWIGIQAIVLSINQETVLESLVVQLSRSEKGYTKFLIYLDIFWNYRKDQN